MKLTFLNGHSLNKWQNLGLEPNSEPSVMCLQYKATWAKMNWLLPLFCSFCAKSQHSFIQQIFIEYLLYASLYMVLGKHHLKQILLSRKLNFSSGCLKKQEYNETKSGSCMFHAGLRKNDLIFLYHASQRNKSQEEEEANC